MNCLGRANAFEPLSKCAVTAVILTTLGSSESLECAMGLRKPSEVLIDRAPESDLIADAASVSVVTTIQR